MAPEPEKKRRKGPAPLAALPLPPPLDAPVDPTAEQPPATLPTGRTGKLTPGQRARLGLDVYSEDGVVSSGEPAGNQSAQPAPAAEPPARPPAQAPAQQPARPRAQPRAQPPAQPPPATPEATPEPVAQTSDFNFSEIDPFADSVEFDTQPAEPEPRLAPAQSTAPAPRLTPAGSGARLAPATAAGARLQEAQQEEDSPRRRRDQQTVAERDGIPQMIRDRNVLSYGVAWTAICLAVTAVISMFNAFAASGTGPRPSMFASAVVSIVIGWIIVVVAREMKNWLWLMVIPAVILVIGPFAYTSWSLGKTEERARAYLSQAAAGVTIDVDESSIVSGTVNTQEGCFAFSQIRASGDVRVDVVTTDPLTAQQQATLALAPRYARRVSAGGARANQRMFVMPKGTLPVGVVAQPSPAIDCVPTGG